MYNLKLRTFLLQLLLLLFISSTALAQGYQNRQWLKSGDTYVQAEQGQLVKHKLPDDATEIFLNKTALVPAGKTEPLKIRSFDMSADEQKVLLYTNTKKVWRYDTRGDYWVYDLQKKTLQQVGAGRPESSLMFAKFSLDGSKVAYVSEHNIYVDDLQSGDQKQLTKDGSRKLINGTFDWAYEEEFSARDGFRWSPDSKKIAYWQLDARQVKDYIMFDMLDGVYAKVIPVEYPVAGEAPSPYKIGVVGIDNAVTRWMEIPGDPKNTYLPRMEWASNANELIMQQLNRKQNESTLYLSNAENGKTKQIYTEKDKAWIDILPSWDGTYNYGGWDWLNGGKEFLWASEKDGWRHLYRVSRDGKKEHLITKGNYDVMEIAGIDEKGGYVYFLASPDNATQQYLYRTRLNGKGKAERLSPGSQPGTHNYSLSPNTKFAQHRFSNHYTKPVSEWVALPDHKAFGGESAVQKALASADKAANRVEFIKVKAADGVEMDAWMAKPANFDPKKKYPILFYVYSEPASQTVTDTYGAGMNFLYNGDMAEDGYIYVSVDNRGTPAPKGRDWRKSIYRKVGQLNISDQAAAARELLKLPYVDASRVAVWGWSGGGSATLNLMFQHPDIYKTGISVAAVANQLTYDNIYQERYMGLPQENREDFVKGSPITYAKNLEGNLLYIHGTGDDNVHYNNAEQLVNELIKYNKHFQFMPYPNRSHSISEGEGTSEHLSTLFTNYLKQFCPPGGR
ncbi:S9 family peptidase [Pontibacter sp. BT310]|uniref:S9 family peptidase n=1 Tax=Pontibacter populi TaxID=890055 RepID=A0ABS6XAX1_9BACT|nr:MULTISPECIES: S9 family peptidase [Pontibacter]MBJ6118168.1 S9 family peptidase [Pontibacter sp. BT310]MBR0570595.1 S9 family peptidase [Microvirga sp. STS03]MBW3365021.1 S9 family peptidase [Pontibacter populi]